MTSIMDSYEAAAFLPSPVPYNNPNIHLDYMSATSDVGALDQFSNFDSEAYVSGDEMPYPHGNGLAHQAMMKRVSNNYEDPFAHETLSQFDQMPGDGLGDVPSVDRDSKYLSFSMPNFPFRLYNESFQQCYINIQAQLHGMFFLAESQWPASMDTAPPPPELTCYRRNLFQITGNVTIPKSLRYIFMEDGRRLPIYDMELQVSATESVEGNPVKIISVPWKTPSSTEPTPKQDDKSEKEPPTITLDKLEGLDMDSDFNAIPIQWKRLQFRIATANNGRRKELQQHFTLHLKVMATVSTGDKFSIAEAHSGAVIVRGRSPRNFAARKDVPLSSSSTSRKHAPSMSRSGDSITSMSQITSAPKQNSPEAIPRSQPIFDASDIQKSEVDLNGWQQNMSSFGGAASPSPAQMYHQPVQINSSASMTFGGTPSPDMPQTPFGFAFSPEMGMNPSAPVSLHFVSDDEGGKSPYAGPSVSRTSSRNHPTSNPSPAVINKPRANTYMTASPPRDLSSEPPNKQRPRMAPQSRSSVMSVSAPNLSQGLPRGMPYDDRSHAPLHTSMSHMSGDSPGTPNGLYEYFPLSLDEWQPPVDAVFRPHVVHHEIPIDPRSPSGRSSKRYFSEVV